MQIKGSVQCLAHRTQKINASKTQWLSNHWEPSTLTWTSFFLVLLVIFSVKLESFDLSWCDYIYAGWWRKGHGKINSLLSGSYFRFHLLGYLTRGSGRAYSYPGREWGSRADKEKDASEKSIPLSTQGSSDFSYCSSMGCYHFWTVSSPWLASYLYCFPEIKLGPMVENCWVSDFCSV